MPSRRVRVGSVALASFLALSAADTTARADTSSATGNETWTAKSALSPQSLIALRGTASSASSQPDSLGLGASVQSSTYVTLSFLTLRSTGAGAIGGSRHGTEGLWSSDLALGALLPLGVGHGPFARVGVRAYMFGNDNTWLSSFEAPAGSVGYQVMRGRWLFEVAGRTGLIIDGRHTRYGDMQGFEVLQRRRLGASAEWGGHVALGYGFAQLEGEYMRVAISDGIDTPLHVASLSACLRPSSVGVCADYRSWKTDVRYADGGVRPHDVSYAGLSIGFWIP
ncbi:MAG: hypothetical protein KF894_02020 [Labilithrix sp.]|nr:hypothetical protein [Labilithrix sp.]